MWIYQTKTDKIPYNFLKKFFSGDFIGVIQDLDSGNNFLKVTKWIISWTKSTFSPLKLSKDWVPEDWCFWRVVLMKTPESLLDFKEIQPVHPKGNQFWVFIGRIDVKAETRVFWPPDAKSWLIWKGSDVGKDWMQEEKGMTEDEMARWHYRLNGHEFG